MRHPHRLSPVQYLGAARYSLTFCCKGRTPWLSQHDVAGMVRDQLLRTAADHHFAIHAYCLMPDHVHVLCEGTDDEADLLEFVRLFKQRTAYLFKRKTGFFDRHLRADEDLLQAIRYVLANPVRAGLVDRVEAWPHVGGTTLPLEEILSSMT